MLLERKKKPISVASRKAKGRKLQQWVCAKISELTGHEVGADEMIASREMGQSGTDVRLIGQAKLDFPFSVECKAQESWSILAWIRQAKENVMPNTTWILIAKRSREKPVVVMDADKFFELLAQMENKPKF